MVRYFGDDATPGSLQVAISRHVTPMVKRVKDHADAGGNCKDLKLLDDIKSGKEVVKYFGSDATPGSLKIALFRHVNPAVKLVKEHADAGGDCKDLDLMGDTKSVKEIVKHFDTTTNRDAIRMAISRHVTPSVKLVLECVSSGGNPMDLNIGSGEVKDAARGSTKELAKHFGSDTTQGGITKMFSRHITPQAKRVREYVQAGGDPKDLNLVGDVKDATPKSAKKG
ncbi:hypothetical protein VTL71DRAFT_5787 [Oculimacula yallundae]|uniref:Uncharacterized protein n=1 Tax=Oculimacula yallundae TaxID=86028 RepID=A0ABR4BYH3_9HELO